MDIWGAKAIREAIASDPVKTEYICRVALLLYDIDRAMIGTPCPLCRGIIPEAHSWQCDFANALDMLDNYVKKSPDHPK